MSSRGDRGLQGLPGASSGFLHSRGFQGLSGAFEGLQEPQELQGPPGGLPKANFTLAETHVLGDTRFRLHARQFFHSTLFFFCLLCLPGFPNVQLVDWPL